MAYFKLRNHSLHTSGRALLWVLGHVSHGQRRSRRRCRVLEGKHPAGERHLRYEITQAAGCRACSSVPPALLGMEASLR